MSNNPVLSFSEILQEIDSVLAQVGECVMKDVAERLATAPRIFVSGAGRSGLLARMFAMRLAQMGCTVFVAGDATTPAIRAGDLLVAISGSGRTATTLALADRALACEAALLLITYSPQSPLAERAAAVLHLPVPTDPDRHGGVAGQQLLGTRFDQCVMLGLDRLAALVAHCRGVTGETMQKNHANLE